MYTGIYAIDEFIKELDEGLDYLEHEITENEVIIYVASNRRSCRCPYCGCDSMRIHSRYEKSFQDLPIMGKKTRIIIENRKFFCDNPDCTFTTFAERFGFLKRNGSGVIQTPRSYQGTVLFPIKAPLNRRAWT